MRSNKKTILLLKFVKEKQRVKRLNILQPLIMLTRLYWFHLQQVVVFLLLHYLLLLMLIHIETNHEKFTTLNIKKQIPLTYTTPPPPFL